MNQPDTINLLNESKSLPVKPVLKKPTQVRKVSQQVSFENSESQTRSSRLSSKPNLDLSLDGSLATKKLEDIGEGQTPTATTPGAV